MKSNRFNVDRSNPLRWNWLDGLEPMRQVSDDERPDYTCPIRENGTPEPKG